MRGRERVIYTMEKKARETINQIIQNPAYKQHPAPDNCFNRIFYLEQKHNTLVRILFCGHLEVSEERRFSQNTRNLKLNGYRNTKTENQEPKVRIF